MAVRVMRYANILFENVENVPRRRLFDRENPLDSLSEIEVYRRYRFIPATILTLLNLVADSLDFGTLRNSPLLPIQQLCIFLRAMATGSFQLVVGDTVRVSQPSVSRCCRRVGRAIARLARRYVRFPDREECKTLKSRFQSIAGFPNVIGLIDGTHVRIQRPKNHEADFINRKGYHSLNVQMVCDHSKKVRSLTAKWPGSTHDARIWRECHLRNQFEQGAHNGFILGDSGYPCTPYLMTPFRTPEAQNQEQFNLALCKTRVLVEQTFGIIKRRFAILHYGIRTDLATAVTYITACVVMHNFGIEHGDILEEDYLDDVFEEQVYHENVEINANHVGNIVRQQLVQRFFN
ncbi:putative nuclease HARBI1 [Dreissena polymorpha]|uniref:putative nuclease HARBI1 n=2 Tax=Dreissena polymorpha TaxID=45954 RepID=UPI002264D2B4|nr:putative nuclease HARBI1 [Dreissena polymorpha]